MKHPFWDRVLIVLSVLILAAVSVLSLCVVASVLTPEQVFSWTGWFGSGGIARLLSSLLPLAVLAIAVLTFMVILPPGKRKDRGFAVQQGEYGTLRISVKALEHLVTKCIAQHDELTCTSVNIHSKDGAIYVDLNVKMHPDINIPLAIGALQRQIKQYLEATSGVDVGEVRVIVEEATDDAPDAPKDSPYAIADMPETMLPKKDYPVPEMPILTPELYDNGDFTLESDAFAAPPPVDTHVVIQPEGAEREEDARADSIHIVSDEKDLAQEADEPASEADNKEEGT